MAVVAHPYYDVGPDVAIHAPIHHDSILSPEYLQKVMYVNIMTTLAAMKIRSSSLFVGAIKRLIPPRTGKYSDSLQ